MELTIDIKYDQVLRLAKKLPYKFKKKLSREIERDLMKQSQENPDTHDKKHQYETENEDLNELQQFLLEGPLMSNEQFDDFKKLRKDFNKWLNQ